MTLKSENQMKDLHVLYEQFWLDISDDELLSSAIALNELVKIASKNNI